MILFTLLVPFMASIPLESVGLHLVGLLDFDLGLLDSKELVHFLYCEGLCGPVSWG